MRLSLRRPLPVVAGVVAALFACGTFSSGAAFAATPTVLCVTPSGPSCYHSIEAAVMHAPPGARINVADGTYAGQVTITEMLTIHGSGSETIINAAGQSHGIYIDGAAAAGTVVEGFTVKNANLEGILVQDTSGVTVRNTVVRNNDNAWTPPTTPSGMASCPGALPFNQDDCGEGLHLLGVADSHISHNIVENNVGGLLLTDETGPTHDNLISGNIVRNNTRDCGITLPSHPSLANFSSAFGVYHNTVVGNLSTGNGGAGVGIFAPTPGTMAYENLVLDNTLTNNGLPGVALHSHAPGQDLNGNVIIGNQISGNAADAPGTGPTGIVVFSDASAGAAPITGMTISNNTIRNEAIDVLIGTSTMNLALHNNNLLGKGMVGVLNAGTGTIDATLNYWGCAGGPGASGCSTVQGTVTYAPWLKQAV